MVGVGVGVGVGAGAGAGVGVGVGVPNMARTTEALVTAFCMVVFLQSFLSYLLSPLMPCLKEGAGNIFGFIQAIGLLL